MLTCYFLNEKVFYFSVPLLLFLASYSWTKRFTFLCHLWLGICLGLSPLAVSLALSESIERGLFYLTAAIAFWTAGFDIIYSLQDRGFDKEKKLSSIPARYGKKIAIIISQIFFVIAIFCFVALGRHFNLAESYFRGILVIAILLFWEQKIIRPLITEKVSREEELVLIEKAFFRANAWVGFVFLVSVIFAKGFF